MSDLQSKLDEYIKSHGHTPNASQFAKYAAIKYSVSSSFLRSGTNTPSKNKPQRTKNRTFSPKATVSTPSPKTNSRNKTRSPTVSWSNRNSVDFSGSSTGSNNPWKQFQKKTSTLSFSNSLLSQSPLKTNSKSNDANLSKEMKKSPKHKSELMSHPLDNSSPSFGTSTVIPTTTITTNRRTFNSAAINMKDVRSDLEALNAEYEAQRKRIESSFETIRGDLQQRENQMLSDLAKYTNRCRGILEKNIEKMERISTDYAAQNERVESTTACLRNGNNAKENSKKADVISTNQIMQRKVTSNAVSHKALNFGGNHNPTDDANPVGGNPWMDSKPPANKGIFQSADDREVESDEWSE